MSQKRFIFQHWRIYVRKEINFITSIKKVIYKSLWTKAFRRILNKSNIVKADRDLEYKLEKFRVLFWRKTLGNSFSVWKRGCFNHLHQIIVDVTGETN